MRNSIQSIIARELRATSGKKHERKFMPSYTPRPWEADDNGKIWGDIDNEALDGDSPLLAEMFGNGKEQRANGRLIAQAPQMLHILESIRPYFDPKFEGVVPDRNTVLHAIDSVIDATK